jgi:hypothetical protein
MKYLVTNAMAEPHALLGVVGVGDVNFCESHHHTFGLFRPKNMKLTATECILLEEFGMAHTNTVVLQDNGIDFSWLDTCERVLVDLLGEDFKFNDRAHDSIDKKLNKSVVQRKHRNTPEYRQHSKEYRLQRRQKGGTAVSNGAAAYTGGGLDFADSAT